ncbi:adenosylcobinamide-GDP ribazoletransferase [Jatrophihabitans sp. DSM 44399]|uniref:Adenosylcobinamide-GDP ribazoletransferase n=1 Tax=Jatrophihabitans lederbergiae TaxID=3075547 RepID=A0ABU2J8S9_9ACTN|nr:adenosylcobinamide-GDP ribazoletransferase [Jatrophihabitans sp. DSM 44399]MDT0261393.1 adenosylcobinamide-GDP ribazoletransferase [Jatrophihabitans sp. DSM 44399]
MSGEPAEPSGPAPEPTVRGSRLVRAGVRLALTTLTVLPLRAGPVNRAVARVAMALAPAVGLCLGAVLAGAGWCLLQVLDPLTAAAVLVAALAMLSRGLHLDGLADTVDALASYRPRERALDIMRSPEVGPLGAAAVVLVLLLQAAALTGLLADRRWAAIVLALGLGRLAIPICCLRRIPAARPDGLGALVAGTVAPAGCLAWALVLGGAAVLAAPSGWSRGVLAVLLPCGAVALLLRQVLRRLGGVTGDVLGAGCETATAIALITLSTH